LFPCCTHRPACRPYVHLQRYKTEAAITRANSFAYPNIDKGSSSNLDHMSSSSGPPRLTGVTSSTPEVPAAEHPPRTGIQSLLYLSKAHTVALLSMSTQYEALLNKPCLNAYKNTVWTLHTASADTNNTISIVILVFYVVTFQLCCCNTS